MRAIRLDEPGPPENFRVVDVPEPDIPPDGVLIRADYAGVIYADAEARRGTYYKETPRPWFPGREVAGTVERIGAAVTSLTVGDKVCALVFGGGCYAEKVLARTAPHVDGAGRNCPASDIVPIASGTDPASALVYLVNYRLAHMLVHGWAKVPLGSRAVVHGASGGMGSMILELLAELGCDAIALVRSEAEAKFCRRLGASATVDTTATDYVAAIRDMTDGSGVAYSFNGVGGRTIAKDPEILAPFGELHLFGYVAGKQAFDPFSCQSTVALKTFNADDFFATEMFTAANKAMLSRFEAGNLLAPGLVLPLSEVGKGHRLLEAGEILGKLVLRP